MMGSIKLAPSKNRDIGLTPINVARLARQKVLQSKAM
jgi:hypothetical protein